MKKRIIYFVAAGIAALAALMLLLFNEGEDVMTPVALCAFWAVIMMVLGLKQKSDSYR
jgi:hypothetical protein